MKRQLHFPKWYTFLVLGLFSEPQTQYAVSSPPSAASSSMFARCFARPSRNLKDAPFPLASLRHRCQLRFNSSTPERTRKFAGAQDDVPPRPRSVFRRRVLVGGGILLGVVGIVALYSFASRRDSFVGYSLVAKEPVSSTASIFHLEPKAQAQKDLQVYKDAWERGIWNVQFKQPQLQIVRAYTPLPPLAPLAAADDEDTSSSGRLLRFLIRKDPHGEVSTYLHNLPLGAEVEVRGPYLEYELTPEVRQVVFFAGGTGIAPALQVAHVLFEAAGGQEDPKGQQKKKKLHILWANRSRQDCLGGVSDPPPAETVPPKPTWSGLFSNTNAKAKAKPKSSSAGVAQTTTSSPRKGPIVEQLEALKQKHPGQITVEYFVNAEDTWIDQDAVLSALSRFDRDPDEDATSSGTPSRERRQILISGPPGFIAHLAGPKEWRNGREEQGSVSRILAHALSRNPHDVKVWKI